MSALSSNSGVPLLSVSQNQTLDLVAVDLKKEKLDGIYDYKRQRYVVLNTRNVAQKTLQSYLTGRYQEWEPKVSSKRDDNNNLQIKLIAIKKKEEPKKSSEYERTIEIPIPFLGLWVFVKKLESDSDFDT